MQLKLFKTLKVCDPQQMLLSEQIAVVRIQDIIRAHIMHLKRGSINHITF